MHVLLFRIYIPKREEKMFWCVVILLFNDDTLLFHAVTFAYESPETKNMQDKPAQLRQWADFWKKICLIEIRMCGWICLCGILFVFVFSASAVLVCVLTYEATADGVSLSLNVVKCISALCVRSMLFLLQYAYQTKSKECCEVWCCCCCCWIYTYWT